DAGNPAAGDDGDWAAVRTITVTAFDDKVREGEHTSLLAHMFADAGGTNYENVSVPWIDVLIFDDDTPGVIVTQTNGSTDVVETPGEILLGDGTISAGGAFSITGDFAFTATGSLDWSTFRFTRFQLSGTLPPGAVGPVAESSLGPAT